jgi:uncharacterized protein YqgQ
MNSKNILRKSSNEELNAYRQRVADYTLAMIQAKKMFKQGIIDMDDYLKCEKVMLERHGLSEKSVFRCLDPNEKSLHDK